MTDHPSGSNQQYWAEVWGDESVARQILQHGTIFRITQARFTATATGLLSGVANATVLDFGCGDGLLLTQLPCRTRLLYEPSPVYQPALRALASATDGERRSRVITSLDEVEDRTVHLVVVHEVAQYMSLTAIRKLLESCRRILTRPAVGVVIADVPHPNKFVDVFGALAAHPMAVTQVCRQIVGLIRSSYSADRLERHTLADLQRVAREGGFTCDRLAVRSFNRARLTVRIGLPPDSSSQD